MKWFKRTSSIRAMVSEAVFLNIKNILVFLLFYSTLSSTPKYQPILSHLEPWFSSTLSMTTSLPRPTRNHLRALNLLPQPCSSPSWSRVLPSWLLPQWYIRLDSAPEYALTSIFARSSRQLYLLMSPCNTALLRATLWRPWSTRLRLMTVLLSWRALSRYPVLLILLYPMLISKWKDDSSQGALSRGHSPIRRSW